MGGIGDAGGIGVVTGGIDEGVRLPKSESFDRGCRACESLLSLLTVLSLVGFLDIGGDVAGSPTTSSDSDIIRLNNEVLTFIAALRTISPSCAMAGRTWDSSRGTKGKRSSGHMSKKLSTHRRAVS